MLSRLRSERGFHLVELMVCLLIMGVLLTIAISIYLGAVERADAVQNTILPFTRNAVGPIDYTPVGFSDNRYPHKTTCAHELALAVLVESGWLHFTDGVAAYRSLPDAPKQFLKDVPVAWDDTRFVDGYPGQYTVLGLLGSEPRVAEADVEEPPTEPGKLLKRAYSIESSNLERNYVEFFLTLVTSGALTPRLFALEHGARLFLSPRAVGTFTLDRVLERGLCLRGYS